MADVSIINGYNIKDATARKIASTSQTGLFSKSDYRRFDNLIKASKGIVYDEETDTEEAYTKDVPSGAQTWASLEKIGGKSVVWNQLVKNGNFESTSNWDWGFYTPSVSNNVCTLTYRGVGSYTLETYTEQITGHLYLFSIDINATESFNGDRVAVEGDTGYEDNISRSANTWERVSGIFRGATTKNKAWVDFYYRSNVSLSSFKAKNAILVDLTKMFGEGNEPSTVEAFKSMFPLDYYEYSTGEIISAEVHSVETKKADTTALASYPIPSEIKALDGYGWSAGSVYNEVDFARKKFIKRVSSRSYQSGDESDTTVITDGTTTYAPLAEPIETDISAYLTDGSYIEVEAGGTITFTQQTGVALPVPNQETYVIKVADAI